jgi:hypothetical protein
MVVSSTQQKTSNRTDPPTDLAANIKVFIKVGGKAGTLHGELGFTDIVFNPVQAERFAVPSGESCPGITVTWLAD